MSNINNKLQGVTKVDIDVQIQNAKTMIDVYESANDLHKLNEYKEKLKRLESQKQNKHDKSNNKLNDEVRFPMNVYEGNIGDKHCNYKTLAIMTLYSNYNNNIEDGSQEQHRYVYKDKIIEFTDEIEELSQNKINTILRNIKKLSNLSGHLVIASKTQDNKIVYTINYRAGEFITNEDGQVIDCKKGSFVLIEQDLLKYLVDVGSNELIKVYLLIKALCLWNERTNDQHEKMITNSYLCEHIGLKPCKNSLQSISNITHALEELHLIKKRVEHRNLRGEFRHYNHYSIVPYDEWREYRYKNTPNRKYKK